MKSAMKNLFFNLISLIEEDVPTLLLPIPFIRRGIPLLVKIFVNLMLRILVSILYVLPGDGSSKPQVNAKDSLACCDDG